MSCDYCDKQADYRFQDGERTCKSCLSKYPTDRRESTTKIVELEKEIRKLRLIIDNGLGEKDLINQQRESI